MISSDLKTLWSGPELLLQLGQPEPPRLRDVDMGHGGQLVGIDEGMQDRRAGGREEGGDGRFQDIRLADAKSFGAAGSREGSEIGVRKARAGDRRQARRLHLQVNE